MSEGSTSSIWEQKPKLWLLTLCPFHCNKFVYITWPACSTGTQEKKLSQINWEIMSSIRQPVTLCVIHSIKFCNHKTCLLLSNLIFPKRIWTQNLSILLNKEHTLGDVTCIDVDVTFVSFHAVTFDQLHCPQWAHQIFPLNDYLCSLKCNHKYLC